MMLQACKITTICTIRPDVAESQFAKRLLNKICETIRNFTLVKYELNDLAQLRGKSSISEWSIQMGWPKILTNGMNEVALN